MLARFEIGVFGSRRPPSSVALGWSVLPIHAKPFIFFSLEFPSHPADAVGSNGFTFEGRRRRSSTKTMRTVVDYRSASATAPACVLHPLLDEN